MAKSAERMREEVEARLLAGFLDTHEAKGIPYVFVRAIVRYCVENLVDTLGDISDELHDALADRLDRSDRKGEPCVGTVDVGASACTPSVLVRPLAPPRAKEEGGTVVFDLVIADLKERLAFGIEKYGMPLIVEDGRPSLIDAYQEIIDLLFYIRKTIEIMKRRFGEVL